MEVFLRKPIEKPALEVVVTPPVVFRIGAMNVRTLAVPTQLPPMAPITCIPAVPIAFPLVPNAIARFVVGPILSLSRTYALLLAVHLVPVEVGVPLLHATAMSSSLYLELKLTAVAGSVEQLLVEPYAI